VRQRHPVQSIHPVQCERVRQQLHAVLTLPVRRLNRERSFKEGKGYQRLCSLITGKLLSAWCTLSLSASNPQTLFAQILDNLKCQHRSVMAMLRVWMQQSLSVTHKPLLACNGEYAKPLACRMSCYKEGAAQHGRHFKLQKKLQVEGCHCPLDSQPGCKAGLFG